MEFKNRISNKFLGLVLLLCLTKVCHGQLMCYVCDDCDKVTLQTPQFECNEDFFNKGEATSSSVQTTTQHSTTTAGITTEKDTTTADETTLTPSTIHPEETTTTTTTTSTTETQSTSSTTKLTTETVNNTTTEIAAETTSAKEIDTTSTTEEQPPSPPTVGPRTTVPTPPTPDTLKPLDDVENLNNRTQTPDQHDNNDEVEQVDVQNGTAKPYKPSAEFRVRQLRSVSDVSFHCFKVKARQADGTVFVNRGCSRVQTNESVCGQWESQHPNEKMNKCYPCSKTKCNGSSALSVSITAFLVAVVAGILYRN